MYVNQKVENSISDLPIGQHKISCPDCQGTRSKNKRDKPLSVNIDSERVVFNCHHCGSNGVISKKRSFKMEVVKEPVKNVKVVKPKKETEGESAKWLAERGICLQTAITSGCIPAEKKYKPVIGFSYLDEDGNVIAMKYRSANGDKMFWWEGSVNRLWGLNPKNKELKDIEDTIVITEGEMDCLAIKTAFKDYANIEVYSVPNGAPSKINDNKIDPSEDNKFKYIWEDRAKFEKTKRIILATDNDSAGDVLAHELARRLNIARCYRIDYKGHKDSNDVLMVEGSDVLRKQVLNAQPIPLHGLNSIDHYQEELQNLYEQGKPRGVTTGFPTVDELFTLATGNLFVVTGYPGDGKSAFIDQLIINVGRTSGWKTCYCSFEKPPSLHAVQLAQVLTGKPFFEGQNPRMNQEEKDFAESWIRDHILFQDYLGGELPTIEAILEKGQSAVMRYGIRCLVIDPYNFIHNDKHTGLETDMVSEMLTKVQLFAKQHDVLVFFVAHPTKPFVRDGKKNVCTGVDIAKSMAWFSKADMGMTVYRGDEGVEIHCWKCRWGWNGSLGSVKLTFNPVNNQYEQAEVIADNYDWDF